MKCPDCGYTGEMDSICGCPICGYRECEPKPPDYECKCPKCEGTDDFISEFDE